MTMRKQFERTGGCGALALVLVLVIVLSGHRRGVAVSLGF